MTIKTLTAVGLLLAAPLGFVLWPHSELIEESELRPGPLKSDDGIAIARENPTKVSVPEETLKSVRLIQSSPMEEEVDPDDYSSPLRDRLYKDRITRESHPQEYDLVIGELAKFHLRRKRVGNEMFCAARFCGFESWDLLEAELAKLEKSDPNLADMLQGLVDEGLKASSRASLEFDRALDDPFHLEVIDPDGPDVRREWMSARVTGNKRGLYRFTSGTAIGDRAFTLHFDSQFFPELEAELIELEKLKTHFWGIASEVMK